MAYTHIIDMVLRVGVAFAFLYPPINAFGDPAAWVGYLPQFTENFIADEALLQLFGVLEVGLAFWVLSGWKIWIPSLVAAALLLGIVAFNMAEFQVLFRDVSIACMAVALALIHWPRQTTRVGS